MELKTSTARLVVNGFNSTNGGGLRILSGFIQYLGDSLKDRFVAPPIVLLSPRHSEALVRDALERGLDARIFRVTGMRPLDQLLLYFLYLPLRALFRGERERLINFGDLIVPFSRRQLYYFDWAYAAVDAPEVWATMAFRQRVGRRLKRGLVRALINTPQTVTVQSQYVAEQVSLELGRTDVIQLSCPVEAPPARPVCPVFELPLVDSRSTRLLCLSSFAPHKNLKILPAVAECLKAKGVAVHIYLTVDETDAAVREFLLQIRSRGLDDVIVNVGVLDFLEVSDCLNACDAVLLPTKLETFGMPYVESLGRRKSVLTSNLSFAREICKTGTLFFNPDDASDIAAVIEEFICSGGVPLDEAEVLQLMENCRPARVYAELLSLSDS